MAYIIDQSSHPICPNRVKRGYKNKKKLRFTTDRSTSDSPISTNRKAGVESLHPLLFILISNFSTSYHGVPLQIVPLRS